MATNLEKMIGELQNTAKYRHITPDLLRRIAERELKNQSNYKHALKAAKNKLHQTAGAYFSSQINYSEFLSKLQEAQTLDQVKSVCYDLMRIHTSTAERLPILEHFYSRIWADLPPLESVIDVACGLNPLTLPWINPLPKTYYAYDIYGDMMAFLGDFLALLGIEGVTQAVDIAQFTPPHPADIGLILKTLPCLEQTDKHISLPLLEAIPARFLLVSYPLQSLGGRDKGMRNTYEVHLRQLLAEKPWAIRAYEFETELAFVVEKNAD